jgi:glycerol-3-phosphate O-acyltransferase/dihydroxyacetone phosphate acyltransferase
LKFLGIKDYQVPSLQGKRLLEDMDENVDGDKILGLIQLVYQILHLLFLLLFSAVPFVLLNLPVGILAGLYAERRRKRALAKSKVKVRGFDVSVRYLLVAVLCPRYR